MWNDGGGGVGASGIRAAFPVGEFIFEQFILLIVGALIEVNRVVLLKLTQWIGLFSSLDWRREYVLLRKRGNIGGSDRGKEISLQSAVRKKKERERGQEIFVATWRRRRAEIVGVQQKAVQR